MRNPVNVIAAAATVLLGVAASVGCHRPSRITKAIDGSTLEKALLDARQPDTAIAAVKRAAIAGDQCQYAEVAARAALDADLHALVPRLLDAAPRTCKRAATLAGERAEAQARAGETARAESAALDVLKKDETNPYAELAQARAAYDKGQMTLTGDLAAKALKDGRGGEAERLLGRSELARGHYQEAEAHFQKLLLTNPNDAEAAFSAAVCNDKLGRYMQAREGFLQTLHIEPKHAVARAYLVMLTHNAGFNDEARHHLAKLAEVMPKDSPTYQQLQQLLDGNTGADGGAPDAGVATRNPGSVQGKR